jgi:hypothetical protein
MIIGPAAKSGVGRGLGVRPRLCGFLGVECWRLPVVILAYYSKLVSYQLITSLEPNLTL